MIVSKKFVTVRIIGGLGNQLFSYAAARRLALTNNAELLVDQISGFKTDSFGRNFVLHHFNLHENLVSGHELFVRSRYFRGMLKIFSRMLPFSFRPFLVEKGNDFDEQLLKLKLKHNVFIQGYWQSEQYFKDIEPQIREEFKIITNPGAEAGALCRQIQNAEAVALHIRREQISRPLPVNYYEDAIELLVQHVFRPHLFVFSDMPAWAREHIRFEYPTVYVERSQDDDGGGWIDLWLMSHCQHFIIANSTFSWWGAWLSKNPEKLVFYPEFFDNWGHIGLIPDGWIPIPEA